MDGISPTLAFAALLFGLSGNPQGAMHQSAMNAQVEEPAACAVVSDAGNPVPLPRGDDPIAPPVVPTAKAGPPAEPCEPPR